MGQMNFSHDTELTLKVAGVLVNSDRGGGDTLGDQAALDVFLDSYGWTGRRDRDAAELDAVHRIRTRLGLIWAAAGPPDGAEERTVELVNDLPADAVADPSSRDAGVAPAPRLGG